MFFLIRMLTLDKGHGSAPAAACTLDLDRETGNFKVDRAWDLIKVGELLYLTVLSLDPREVGLPDDPAISCFPKFSRHVFELSVEPVHVDPDYLDLLLDKPESGFAGHPRLLEVFRAPQVPVSPVHDHHDVKRLKRVIDVLQRFFEILRSDLLARFLVPEIQDNPV